MPIFRLKKEQLFIYNFHFDAWNRLLFRKISCSNVSPLFGILKQGLLVRFNSLVVVAAVVSAVEEVAVEVVV